MRPCASWSRCRNPNWTRKRRSTSEGNERGRHAARANHVVPVSRAARPLAGLMSLVYHCPILGIIYLVDGQVNTGHWSEEIAIIKLSVFVRAWLSDLGIPRQADNPLIVE